MDTAAADAARQLLLYVLMPLWIGAAFADWLCHRHTGIEHSSGVREALLHWLMLAEFGVPLLAALFLEINALVVALMLGAFLLHEVTVYVDLRFAGGRREIPPIEQIVHAALEWLPALAATVVLLWHWPALLSLLGLGAEAADFTPRPRAPPLPAGQLAVFAAALLLYVVLPYAEELWRCLRAERRPA